MLSPSITQSPSTVHMLAPTVIDLETEHYSQAQALATQTGNEQTQWESYLGALSLLAFEDWFAQASLSERLTRLPQTGGALRYLTLGKFRLCIITTEESLSESITIAAEMIDTAEKAAHFYLLLEVAEEQAEVWFRGLIRHDQLSQLSHSNDAITVPLSALESEMSRLFHYCRYLEPNMIPLPESVKAEVQASPDRDRLADITDTVTQLGQWLGNAIAEGWQTLESLTGQPAYATRGLADGVQRGKLVNLGLQVAEQPVALVLTVTPEADDKIGILVQLLPTGSDRILPPSIALSLVSQSGNVLQTAIARSRDNYIQLKSFRGRRGQQFSIQVELDQATVSEDFEI